jgi:integrase
MFFGIHGGPLSESVWDRWWKIARKLRRLRLRSRPHSRRAYDLRHAAASLWLNAGVPATEVARRLGHSVKVLLTVYGNLYRRRRGRVQRPDSLSAPAGLCGNGAGTTNIK